jgi:hypothetical protein
MAAWVCCAAREAAVRELRNVRRFTVDYDIRNPQVFCGTGKRAD